MDKTLTKNMKFHLVNDISEALPLILSSRARQRRKTDTSSPKAQQKSAENGGSAN
jgi:hypothetical protein